MHVAAGGRVTGIIPVALMPRELSGESIGETVKVDSMHTRKAKMAAMSDAFIALPGGYGTLEELLESVTWTQLGVHSKPIGVLNVGGYYDHLLAQIAHSRDEGFISASSAALLVSSADPKDLIDKLLTTVPPAGLTRWLTENQL